MTQSTKPMRRAGVMLATLVMAGSLAAGCGGSDDPEETAAGAAGSTSSAGSSAAPDASTSPAPEEEVEETTAPDPQVEPTEPPGGKACLAGNWFLDNAEFAALMSGAAGGAVDDVTGSVMLSLGDDGSTRTYYDDWSHTITVKSSTVTIVKDGMDTGTYEVTGDGTMSLVDTKINSTTSSKMTINGQTVTQAVKPEPSVFSQASFTCAGDKLTVTADGGTTVMHREH